MADGGVLTYMWIPGVVPLIAEVGYSCGFTLKVLFEPIADTNLLSQDFKNPLSIRACCSGVV